MILLAVDWYGQSDPALLGGLSTYIMDIPTRSDSILLNHSLLSLARRFDISHPQKKSSIPAKRTNTRMVNINTPEALRSPMASPIQADSVQSDTNSQIDLVQVPRSGTTRDSLSGTNVEVGQGMYAGMPHHHDERSSTAKMWDPVKDCSDPNTTPADPSGLFPDVHSSEQLMGSNARNVTSTDFYSLHGGHRYGQAQGARQLSTTSGIRGAASMGPPPFPLSRTMVFGPQGRALMGSQTFQRSPSYDQARRRPHHGYEDTSALDRLANESLLQNRQRPLDSIPRGAALLVKRPRRPNYLNRQHQENEQPTTPVHTASVSTGSNPSTQRRSDQLNIGTGHDPQQADSSQHQSLLTTTAMSQALGMGRYGESLEQQSNYADALRVYERACALLQEVIIRSPSFEERMECDLAVS